MITNLAFFFQGLSLLRTGPITFLQRAGDLLKAKASVCTFSLHVSEPLKPGSLQLLESKRLRNKRQLPWLTDLSVLSSKLAACVK